MTQKHIIICGNALNELKKLSECIVDCVVTSPPYWRMRDYGEDTEDIYETEAGKSCNHDFENRICKKCRTYHGQLGLEFSASLYIAHLIQIFKDKRS